MTIKFSVDKLVNEKNQRCDLKVTHNEQILYDESNCSPGKLHIELPYIDKDAMVMFNISNKKGSYTLEKSDTAFKITKILINGVDYYDKINLYSNYYTQKGVIRTNGYMGFNGTYVFKFRYPLSRHILMCDFNR